jgi:hypothetical protein
MGFITPAKIMARVKTKKAIYSGPYITANNLLNRTQH